MIQLKPDFSSVERILEMYDRLVPSNTKVIQALRAETTNEAERDCLKHLKRYIRGFDNSKLKKFLKFTTGSDLMIFDELQVAFNQNDSLARRPIAHTCGFVLEMSSTYQSFPEVREEFNNVLSADSWEMDIA